MSKLTQAIEENRKKAWSEGMLEARAQAVLRVMEEFGCSEEKAMQLLRLPKDERELVREMAIVNMHKFEP